MRWTTISTCSRVALISRTTKSSPPSLATTSESRQTSLIRSAKAISTSSPAWRPWTSLMRWKSFRSRESSETGVAWRVLSWRLCWARARKPRLFSRPVSRSLVASRVVATRDRRPSQIPQDVDLLPIQGSRCLIRYAEGADPAIVKRQGAAGIEADMGLALNKRIVVEADVFQGIEDDEHIGPEDGVGAERNVSRGIGCIQTRGGFRPLPMFIHQADHGDRRLEDLLGQICEPIETGLLAAVEKTQGVKLCQAKLFVVRGLRRFQWSPLCCMAS